MASVDDRVVAMKFDNTSFEAKIATTMASLDKLKGSLDFANAKRGIGDLTAASNAFNLNGIASAVEGISSHFTAMGAVAFSVIQNIANKAVDAGIRIVKGLSLDQVTAGFREYETNMNAIQTVLANTKADGTNLQDVNKALDQLNEYSDQTIYNFGEMAKNIGTFTAAGVNLDTSVSAIKGIANLAAISGSNSQQASTAMYQLSQALASGSVKLMDWNSIVNAGMGGEVFQKSLFETGKALGTIKDVPIGMTFEEWTAAGNTFRGSLEQGWITSEVLTNTLEGFTGDLTDAQLKAMGYNDEQIKQIQEMGNTGRDAATKVKTLTQLISTIKESIGSGWSASFKLMIGDFDEARALFTGISNVVGGMFTKAADERNSMLQSWKILGGRDMVLNGLVDGLKALWAILTPIKEAFQDVFPPMTVKSLYDLSKRFQDFMATLMPAPSTIFLIQRAFRGVFSILSIGWEVVKGIAGIFVDLFKIFTGAEDPNSGILGFFARLGNQLFALKQVLVDGGGIAAFFDKISEAITSFFDGLTFTNVIDRVVSGLQSIKDAIFGFFQGDQIDTSSGVMTSAFDRVTERFGWVGDAAQRLSDTFGRVFSAIGVVWDWTTEKLGQVVYALSGFVDFIKETFSGLPAAISEALGDADYSLVLDTINVGLFAGLVLLFKKFSTGGFFNMSGLDKLTGNLDGMVRNITASLDAVTGRLQAMQQNVKADTLMKIAKAIALLTVSVFVLSLIDSVALTKALIAMSVGFGQLVATMAVLERLSTGMGAAKMAALAVGIMLIAGSMILLAIAAKIMATMSWEEMAKGLLGVSVMLAVLSATMKPLSKNAGGMISTGIGIMFIAIALNILALAVKSFAEMEWEAMAQGLVGVAGGLLIITVAMRNLPGGMMAKGAGLILVAVALNILALAVKSFAEMEWAEMGKGMAGIAAALLIIAGAMYLMPNGILLALQGAGLLMIGIGLVAIAKAVSNMSSLSWTEMARGLAGVAGVLIILAIAAHAMSGTILGAIAIGIISVSLGLLAIALGKFSDFSWGELLKGLAGIAGVLGLFAGAAYILAGAIPVLLGLGLALILIGAGFALFGVGANMFAIAFALVVSSGTEGVATLIAVLDVLIQHLPKLMVAFAKGIIQIVEEVVKALPGIISGFDEIIVAILDTVINAIPKIAETFTVFIMTMLDTIETLAPEVIATGLSVLMAFLQGIRDNIFEITVLVVDIITEFLDALALKVPEIIDSVYNLVVAIITGVVEKLVDVASYLWPKGVELLGGLLGGITEKMGDILNWFTELPGKILGWLGDVLTTLKEKGVGFITGLLAGIVEKAIELATWFINLHITVLEWIGDVASTLASKGWDFISGLIGGIINKAVEVMNWFMNLPSKILSWLGDVGETLLYKGKSLLSGLLSGILNKMVEIKDWFLDLPSKIKDFFVDAIDWLFDIGKDVMQGLWEGMKDIWNDATDWLSGLNPANWFNDINPYKGHAIKNLVSTGEAVFMGLHNGMKEGWEDVKDWLKEIDPSEDIKSGIGDKTTKAIADALSVIPERLGNMEEFNPTITPVLDLTNVERGAGQLSDILRIGSDIKADLSYNQAAILSVASQPKEDIKTDTVPVGPTEIKFEQYNYSPEALSTSDIYRQTRNQIAMAKEELAVV